MHTCTVCFLVVDRHPEHCDVGGVEHDHFPPLCCPGCHCGSFELAH